MENDPVFASSAKDDGKEATDKGGDEMQDASKAVRPDDGHGLDDALDKIQGAFRRQSAPQDPPNVLALDDADAVSDGDIVAEEPDASKTSKVVLADLEPLPRSASVTGAGVGDGFERRETLTVPGVGNLVGRSGADLTPAHGHTGLSIEGAPVGEPEAQAGLPPAPGRAMTDDLLADMNRKDEDDLKSDIVPQHTVTLEARAGTTVWDLGYLSRARDEDIERQSRKLDDAEERAVQEIRRKAEGERRKIALVRERRALVIERKELYPQLKGKNALLEATRAVARRHVDESNTARKLANETVVVLLEDLNALQELITLRNKLVASAKAVGATRTEAEVDAAAVAGNEALIRVIPLLQPRPRLETAWSEFVASCKLALVEDEKRQQVVKNHQPLVNEVKALKAQVEAIDEKIKAIDLELAQAAEG